MSMNFRTLILLIIGGFFLAGLVRNVSAQNSDMKNITAIIKNSNAHELASYFNKNINLRINTTEGIYSKVQAEQLLDNFFKKNKAVWFEIKGKGNLSESSEYIIASYITDKDSFRVYMMVKGIPKKEIYQLSFRKEL